MAGEKWEMKCRTDTHFRVSPTLHERSSGMAWITQRHKSPSDLSSVFYHAVSTNCKVIINTALSSLNNCNGNYHKGNKGMLVMIVRSHMCHPENSPSIVAADHQRLARHSQWQCLYWWGHTEPTPCSSLAGYSKETLETTHIHPAPGTC